MSDGHDERELRRSRTSCARSTGACSLRRSADDLDTADERTRNTVRWMQSAWRELEPPRALLPPALARPATAQHPLQRVRWIAVAAAVLLVAGGVLWRLLLAAGENARPSAWRRLPCSPSAPSRSSTCVQIASSSARGPCDSCCSIHRPLPTHHREADMKPIHSFRYVRRVSRSAAMAPTGMIRGQDEAQCGRRPGRAPSPSSCSTSTRCRNVDIDELFETARQLVGRQLLHQGEAGRAHQRHARARHEDRALRHQGGGAARAQLLARLDVPSEPPVPSKVVEYRPRFVSLEHGQAGVGGLREPQRGRGARHDRDERRRVQCRPGAVGPGAHRRPGEAGADHLPDDRGRGRFEGAGATPGARREPAELLPGSQFTQIGMSMLKTAIGGGNHGLAERRGCEPLPPVLARRSHSDEGERLLTACRLQPARGLGQRAARALPHEHRAARRRVHRPGGDRRDSAAPRPARHAAGVIAREDRARGRSLDPAEQRRCGVVSQALGRFPAGPAPPMKRRSRPWMRRACSICSMVVAPILTSASPMRGAALLLELERALELAARDHAAFDQDLAEHGLADGRPRRQARSSAR